MRGHIGKGFIIILGVIVGFAAASVLINLGGQSLSFASNYIGGIRSDMEYVSSSNKSGEDFTFLEDDSGQRIFETKQGVAVKTYKVKNPGDYPNVVSQSFLVGDLETGEILFSKNKDRVYPIASITKLMTAIVADEIVGITKDLIVSSRAVSTYGKQGRLEAGENYTILELLYPLLLESSNDAAEVIAESVDRKKFMADMNGKAKSLGLFNTYFDDPSGLSAGNTSTSADLFTLVQYIDSHRDYIFDITVKKRHMGQKIWYNNSKFRLIDEYVGGKNGYTDLAGKTQIAIFEIDFEGEKRRIVFIVLKTDDVERDIFALWDLVEKFVKYE